MTKTRIAQMVVSAVVASKTSSLTKETISAHTHYEEDSIAAVVGGAVVAGVVVSKTDPITDAKVAQIAAWITAKKEARNNK